MQPCDYRHRCRIALSTNAATISMSGATEISIFFSWSIGHGR